MDCSPPGSSVHEISQARILEWFAISFSRGSSWPRDRARVSCIGGQILYHWVPWEAPKLWKGSVRVTSFPTPLSKIRENGMWLRSCVGPGLWGMLLEAPEGTVRGPHTKFHRCYPRGPSPSLPAVPPRAVRTQAPTCSSCPRLEGLIKTQPKQS